MDDYNDALQTLRPDDLAYLVPCPPPAKPAKSPPTKRGKPRRPSPAKTLAQPDTRNTQPDAAVEPTPPKSAPAKTSAQPDTRNVRSETALNPTSPESTPAVTPVLTAPVAVPKAAYPITGTPAADHDAARRQPAETAAVVTSGTEASASERKRQHIEREWPAVGTVLVGDYCGTRYHAEIVPAKKRLKSGKQIRLLDGPAKGKRLDSFSKAMQVATAKQRRVQKLGNHGMANGWSFWVAETAVSSIAT